MLFHVLGHVQPLDDLQPFDHNGKVDELAYYLAGADWLSLDQHGLGVRQKAQFWAVFTTALPEHQLSSKSIILTRLRLVKINCLRFEAPKLPDYGT